LGCGPGFRRCRVPDRPRRPTLFTEWWPVPAWVPVVALRRSRFRGGTGSSRGLKTRSSVHGRRRSGSAERRPVPTGLHRWSRLTPVFIRNRSRVGRCHPARCPGLQPEDGEGPTHRFVRGPASHGRACARSRSCRCRFRPGAQGSHLALPDRPAPVLRGCFRRPREREDPAPWPPDRSPVPRCSAPFGGGTFSGGWAARTPGADVPINPSPRSEGASR
jgi:hypothetical protein